MYALSTSPSVGQRNKKRDTSLILLFSWHFSYGCHMNLEIRDFRNMVKNTSIRYSCPGCERNNFQSLTSIKKHFRKERHSFQCSVCQRVFKNELGIIQHYQKYNKSNDASPDIPNDVPRIASSNIPLKSVPSSSAVVTPVLCSNSIQTDAPKVVLNPSEQRPEITDDQLLQSLLDLMPVLNFEEGPILGQEPRIYPVANPRLTFISTETLPSVQFGIPVYPTILDPLEQNLILRYLRSRCHPWSRLQTQGYFLRRGSTGKSRGPSKGSIHAYDFRETPHSELQAAGSSRAIAIDCEMVEVRNGRQTLAFLSAIDFLTGEVLISRYVNPVQDVVDWRSKFSGMTRAIMASAIASNAAFGSWREARARLCEFIDDSTVLVGHSLNYDLEVLGICHAKVVDSAILTAETVFPSIMSTKLFTRMWGLKTLAKDLLNLDIQTSDCGHSALEDAYATRDVVIWCIRNPEELKLWAENARRQEEESKFARNRQKYGKSRSKVKLPATQSTRNWEYNTEYDDDSEIIRWSDLAEDLGWPEGYDPWSD